MNKKISYHVYALVTILFWSLAYVLSRLALQHFSSFSLGFLRYLIASLFLLVFALIKKLAPPKKKDLILFLLSGAFGFFLYMIFFNQGQRTATASTASVIIATAPVMTAIMARFIYKEKMHTYQWISVIIEFSGVIVLTMLNGSFSLSSGIVWLLLAAFALSTYNLLQRELTKNYTAMQTATYSIFFGTIMLSVFLPGSVSEAVHAPAIQLVYVFILGIFCSAVAYVSWSKALSLAEQTSQVSNYMFLTPFVTSLLGFIIAKEIPDRATIIGGSIILLGVFVFTVGKSRLSVLK